MPVLSNDRRVLLRLFRKHGVEFAVCGGHAVAFHGYPRATMDIDLLVAPGPENADRIAGMTVRFVGLDDLLAAKREAARAKDLADIEGLQPPNKHRRKSSSP